MGSFWGHVREGLFFIILGVWWLLHAFREYILTESKGKVMRPNIHYDVIIRNRPLPVEIIFKILFPTVAFLGDFFDGGVRFQDENGNFVKLVYQQHMTVDGILVIHAVTDLMAWLRAPLFPCFNYLTGFLAFLWSGVAFYYHASMHGKEPVETIIHVLPVYIMFVAATAILLEIKWREGVWTMVIRSYCVLTLGTWFSHVAFMLYVSDRFPGWEDSNLDRSDPNNVTYVKAMFGLHLLANLVISVVLYLIVYITLRVRLGIHMKDSNLDRSDPNNVTYVKAMFGLHLLANLVISVVLYLIVYITLRVRLGIHMKMPRYGELTESLDGINYLKFKPKHGGKQDASSEDSSLLLGNEQTCISEESGF